MLPGSVRHRLDGDIGEMVREARRYAGFNQAELAAAIGTTQSAVSRWERGHDVPRADTLVAILRACGYEADLVLRRRDSGVDRAQIRAMLRMPPEQRLRQVKLTNDFVRSARRVS